MPSVAGTAGPGALDANCLKFYGMAECAKMKLAQNVTATLLDTMRAAAYEPHLYGKVDVGAGQSSSSTLALPWCYPSTARVLP